MGATASSFHELKCLLAACPRPNLLVTERAVTGSETLHSSCCSGTGERPQQQLHIPGEVTDAQEDIGVVYRHPACSSLLGTRCPQTRGTASDNHGGKLFPGPSMWINRSPAWSSEMQTGVQLRGGSRGRSPEGHRSSLPPCDSLSPEKWTYSCFTVHGREEEIQDCG